jgi:hypothetical protein
MLGMGLAATVVCFAFGSSAVAALHHFGGTARWVALVALCGVAIAALVRHRPGLPAGARAVVITLGAFLAGLAFASVAWSGDPRLTFHRAASFAIALVAAASLGGVAARDGRVAPACMVAVVVAVACLDAAGLLWLLFPGNHAAQQPTTSAPWRFRGLGENPNTLSMLAGLTIPLAVWAALAPARSPRRALGAAAAALAFATITLSGSRGALAAAAAGTLVTAFAQLSAPRRAFVLAGAVVVASLASVALSRIPQPSLNAAAPAPSGQQTTTATTAGPGTTTGVTTTSAAGPTTGVTTTTGTTPAPPLPPRGPVASDYPYGRLSDEVGQPQQRTLFSSSGRVQAWRGAIAQGNERPLLGYGFGTEARVFFDRYQTFESDVVENSFIGLYLQLGAVGVVALLALLATIGGVGFRGGPPASLRASTLGVVGGGGVLMCVQSYAYSVGNVSMVPFWAAAGLVVAESASSASRLPRGRIGVLTGAAAAALLLAVLIPLGRLQRDRAVDRTGASMQSLVALVGPRFEAHLSGGRIAYRFDCLLYAVGKRRAALEFCFSADGHLAEAIDRRRASPRFFSLRDDPGESSVHPPVAVLLARFHQVRLFTTLPRSFGSLPVSVTDYAPVMLPIRAAR